MDGRVLHTEVGWTLPASPRSQLETAACLVPETHLTFHGLLFRVDVSEVGSESQGVPIGTGLHT